MSFNKSYLNIKIKRTRITVNKKHINNISQAEQSIIYVRVKSNRDQAPPPGNLTFEKIIGKMPAQTGRNHSQMPCYRGSPGSGILAKIKLNKYFKIKKNEK
jgi:hypothetical protein